jgi:amino acid transporter
MLVTDEYQAESTINSDTDPLLPTAGLARRYLLSAECETPKNTLGDGTLYRVEDSLTSVELCDNVPPAKGQLGVVSVIFLIFNGTIGTGIFATPSIILRSAGSVGVALLMWVVGASIAAAGTAVYIELGSGMPRSGGEKNYLEFMYRRPKFLVTCVYAGYTFLQGSGSANSLVFSKYIMHALSIEPTTSMTRFVTLICLTFCLVMHGIFLKWGLRLQNALGLFKLVILCLVALTGMLHVIGTPGFKLRDGIDIPRNFTRETFWEGSGTSINALATGMMYVIWSFDGYSSANYVLSEVRDPVWTMKRAAPAAMMAVTLVYMLVNLAYFSVVSKRDILEGGEIVAALFFRNLFGPATEKILSLVMSLSALGNVLTVLFTQGRVIQELGREGILPYSSFFASNEPFQAPLPGLFALWLVSSVIMIGVPPGDAFSFMLNLPSYILALTNAVVAVGLLALYTPAYKGWNWSPPFKAFRWTVVFFLLANMFLVFVPFVPPSPGTRLYAHLPYWFHAVVSWLMSVVGIAFWYHQFVWLPKRYGYQLERELVLQNDGTSRIAFHKVVSK